MTQYVFLTGTGRCGSSLVQEIICRHPGVGFISNVDDRVTSWGRLGRWNNEVYRRVPQALTRKGRIRFAPSEAYRILEEQVSPLLVTPGRALTADDGTPWLDDRISAFFGERARLQGRPVFVHKFTGWPRVGLLDRVDPTTRHVHVVRDPRAVVSSLLQMPWWTDWETPGIERALGPERMSTWRSSGWSVVVLAALVWQAEMQAHASARELVGEDRWLELRYEDVLDSPHASFRRVTDFAGLPADPVLDRQLDRYQLSSTRADAYRRELDAAQVRTVETLLGDDLARHGYTT